MSVHARTLVLNPGHVACPAGPVAQLREGGAVHRHRVRVVRAAEGNNGGPAADLLVMRAGSGFCFFEVQNPKAGPQDPPTGPLQGLRARGLNPLELRHLVVGAASGRTLSGVRAWQRGEGQAKGFGL